MSRGRATGVLCWFAGGLIFAGLALPVGAATNKFQNLHRFCSQANCTDGIFPTGVVSDQSGNIYGVTEEGGNINDAGVVYELTPNGNGGYNFAVLYSFCAYHNCPDGAGPSAVPIIDSSGNVYGTTGGGGANGEGTVYELSPTNGGWTEKVLYSFCSQANCDDGIGPVTQLIYAGLTSGQPYDGVSPLYGATEEGGAGEGGVVFTLQPSRDAWTEQTLYGFTSPSLPAGLTLDSFGNLFGSLEVGGKHAANAGGIFELSPNGGSWTDSSVYEFCPTKACTSGASPTSSPYIDSVGRIWGTTAAGGDLSCTAEPGGCGTMFALTPGENGYSESNIHVFCKKQACRDGARPDGTLQPDGHGDLFGTALDGANAQDGGSLFELTGSTFKVLHTFCQKKCDDGNQPMQNLVVTPAGNVIGTTFSGESNQQIYGAVYEFTPGTNAPARRD